MSVGVLFLGGDFITTKAWARVIQNNLDDVGVFNEILKDVFANGKGNQRIIYLPKDNWGKRETNPTLVVSYEYFLDVYFYDSKTQNISNVRHEKNSTLYVERRKSLLHSWVEICSLQNDTRLITRLEFNSVLISIFQPIIDQFRQYVYSNDNSILESHIRFYDDLDYRFKSYIRDIKIPTHEIKSMIFQDRIYKNYLIMLKKTIQMPHLFILTHNEFIVISEGEFSKTKWNKYEEIYRFYNMNNIKNITLDHNDSKLYVELNDVILNYYLDFNNGFRIVGDINR